MLDYISALERIQRDLVPIQRTVELNSKDELSSDSSSLVLSNLFTLNKHSTNLNNIRKELLIHKNGGEPKAREFLRALDSLVEELKFDCEFYLETKYERAKKVKEDEKRVSELSRGSGISDGTHNANDDGDDDDKQINQGEEEEESIDALRKKLLSTSKPSQLDSLKSMESDNKYHESIQEEYISDISSFVQQLKESAMQFQETIKQDAILLKQASDEIEKSNGKLNNVGELLKLYHTKNKLSLWFYIRLLVGLFLVFFFLVLLIRLIPARA